MSGVPDTAAEWSQTTRGADVVVEARDVVRVYGSGEARVVALGGVSLSVGRGQFVAIMGPSGSGKSTLLHCLAGLDSPTSGSVLIAGQDLAGMGDKQLTAVRRDRLGFVFQALPPSGPRPLVVPTLWWRRVMWCGCTGRVRLGWWLWAG